MSQYKLFKSLTELTWSLYPWMTKAVPLTSSIYKFTQTGDIFLFIEQYDISSNSGYKNIELKFLHLKSLKLVYRSGFATIQKLDTTFEEIG